MMTRLRMNDGSPGFSPDPDAKGTIPGAPGSPEGVAVPEPTPAMLATVALVPKPAPLRADLELRKGFFEKTLVPNLRRSISSTWFCVGGR